MVASSSEGTRGAGGPAGGEALYVRFFRLRRISEMEARPGLHIQEGLPARQRPDRQIAAVDWAPAIGQLSSRRPRRGSARAMFGPHFVHVGSFLGLGQAL